MVELQVAFELAEAGCCGPAATSARSALGSEARGSEARDCVHEQDSSLSSSLVGHLQISSGSVSGAAESESSTVATRADSSYLELSPATALVKQGLKYQIDGAWQGPMADGKCGTVELEPQGGEQAVINLTLDDMVGRKETIRCIE
jgi:hypothetical protein